MELAKQDEYDRKLLRRIVKYLKQYARDEPTYDVNDEGDIDIDISK